MGISQKEAGKVKANETAQIKKKKFDESFLDIYIIGNYDKLMDLLIGERKDNISDINEERIKMTSEKNHDFQKEDNSINIETENINQNISSNKVKLDKNHKDENKDKETKNLGFINYIQNFNEHKNYINSFENYSVKNSTFNWNFHFYCNESISNKNIEKIKEKINENIEYKNKRNNVLLVFTNSLFEIYEIINIFKTINKEFHPLFLFIMKNIENEEQNNNEIAKIKNYINTNNINMFNLRNITIKNYVDLEKNTNEKIVKSYILDIYLYFINSWLYYNHFGDEFGFQEFIEKEQLNALLNDIAVEHPIKKDNEDKGSGLFNILIIGRPGVGKSTLINILSQSKRAMESKGINVTKYINKFVLKKYNISLYDSPGFEFDTDITEIKSLIEELNKQLTKKRNQIHLIFYLLNAQCGRDFYDSEIEILKVLMDNEIYTFFLLTFCPDKDFGNEVKEVVEKDLKKKFIQLDKVRGTNYFKDKIKVFPTHLLDEMNDSCQNFGLRTVLDEAYNKFKNYIIDEKNIEELQNNLTNVGKELNQEKKNKIYQILNKNNNIIYKYLGDIDNLLDYAIDESKKDIIYFSFCYSSISSLGLFGFLPIPFLQDHIKKNLLSNVSEKFRRTINKKEQEDSLRENIEKINYNDYKSKIPFINKYHQMKNWGNHFINKYSKELNDEGLNGISKYLINLIKCYNISIISLKEIGKQFNE